MAIRYWVGGASADAADAANWSSSSGGSGGSAPGTSDTAVLDGATSLKTISEVKASSNQLVSSSHGFSTEDPVWIESSENILPSPLAERTTYYVISVNSNTISLATSSSNAAAGTAIDITDEGLETLKIRKVTYCMLPDGFDVSSIEIHSTFAGTMVMMSAAVTVRKGLYVNGNIEGADGGITFTTPAPSATSSIGDFASGGHIGSALSYNTRMVLNGKYAQITGTPGDLNYTYACTQSPVKFDDGPYPYTSLNAASGATVVFSPEYIAPTTDTFEYYDDGVAYFTTFKVTNRAASPPEFRPNASSTNENTDGGKKFKMETFICQVDEFDGGYAEWNFVGAASTNFYAPLTGSSDYGNAITRWKCTIRKYKFTANTAGHIVNMREGQILHCESLEIGDGCVLRGPGYTTSTNSAEIHCVKPPKILGSWNFSQVVPGVYRSPITQSPKAEPHCALIRLQTTTSGFASGSLTLCALDAVDIDTANAWNSSNTKWVVPRSGRYLINFGVAIENTTTSHLAYSALYLNTGSGLAIKTYGDYSYAGSFSPSTGTIILNLSKDNELALYAYHNGGASKNLVGDATRAGMTYLQIIELV